MSREPTSRNPDLDRLRDEGYDLSLVAGLLIVRGIPFVDADANIRSGMLVVPLEMAGDRTAPPRHHSAFWGGGMPCDHLGRPLHLVVERSDGRTIAPEITVSHQLCNKPRGREFVDHHELVTTYVALIASHAVSLDPSVTAKSRRDVVPIEDPQSPFRYMDTASARAGSAVLGERFPKSVALVGLGGTGGYLLDLVAKTPVRTIHLFDADAFLQHNAFRAPGAASIEDLEARRTKVDHFASIYSRVHTGIVPHPTRLDRRNVALLDAIDFAFLCLDDGPAKRPIAERLERNGTSFIDVGMGLEMGPDGLFGTLRVTTSTPDMRAHVRDKDRIPFLSGGVPDPYGSNIQIAELNALNAALAVVRWKRMIGFYADGGREHHSTYDLDGNHMNNADRSASRSVSGLRRAPA
ncbi:ThiF family adenylyltransferase [Sphingomonas panni]|uniref:ThiF family adenylyltransferase n=1 Tax=Sphingomonas panni TaxID=237612 RepID=UPI001F5B949C|nr:ThiF family adenylyltransferase [Sphingomonas panni]